MKIAHLNYCPSAGVLNKIKVQAKAAQELGLDFDFIVLSHMQYQPTENVKFYKINLPQILPAKRVIRQFFSYNIISSKLDLSSYDRIILRYPSAVALSFKKFFKKYHIITEYHSDIINELKSLKVGYLNFLRIFLEKHNSPKLLPYVRGIIGLTDEIRKQNLHLIDRDIPSAVISNGVEVKNTSFTQFKPFDGRILNLIFIASTIYPWHGVDRLIYGLSRYSGDFPINLFLAGFIYEKEKKRLLENFNNPQVKIHCLGLLPKQELDEYFSRSNLAIGSLALFRKNLTDACPLKASEYMARVIPFVYAYNNVDLPTYNEYTLKLSNTDSPIDMQKLIQFARKVSKNAGLSKKMRNFAQNHLDWKIKIQQMYDFTLTT